MLSPSRSAAAARHRAFAALCLSVVVFAVVLASPAARGQASDGLEVVSFEIRDPTGRSVEAPLVAGTVYAVSAVYRFSATFSERVVFSTACERPGNEYWRVEGSFPGHDPVAFRPGQSSFSVRFVEGTLDLRLTCSLPTSLTTRSESGEDLHFVKPAFGLLTVQSEGAPEGSLLRASRTMDVTDAAILDWEDARSMGQQALATLEGAGATATLQAKAAAILTGAENLASAGRVRAASNTARAVPSGDDVPASNSAVFLVVAAIAALIAILALVLLMRTRGAHSTVLTRRDEARLEVESVSEAVKRLDRSLAERLKKAEDLLKDPGAS